MPQVPDAISSASAAETAHRHRTAMHSRMSERRIGVFMLYTSMVMPCPVSGAVESMRNKYMAGI